MAEALAPIDAETVVVAALKSAFASRSETARVGTRVPAPAPARMVRVSLVDTVATTLGHYASRLLFECWAGTEVAASALARTTYALVRAFEDETIGAGVWVADVTEVGGVVNFPDETGATRYQFTVDLTIGGELI